MAKIFKTQIYLIDYDDNMDDIEDFKHHLKQMGYEFDGLFEIGEVKESEEFEWDDELTINRQDSTTDDIEEYFNKK